MKYSLLTQAAMTAIAAFAMGPIPAFAQDAIGVGTEDRNWINGDPKANIAAAAFNVEKKDLTLTLKDGTKLDADLFMPVLGADAETPACLLVSNGYGIEGGSGSRMNVPLYEAAANGYAALHVSLRGSGSSEGTSELYYPYGPDTAEIIDWMVEQEWCNGNVGMMGTSMLGITQWLTLQYAPEGLKAISPWVGSADPYTYLWYPGGMRPGPAREKRPDWEYGAAIQHRDADDWWQMRILDSDELAEAAGRGVAVLISGGYNDYVSPGQIAAWKDYTSADGAKKQLILGPFDHSSNGKPHFVFERELEFFDHYLRGKDNPVGKRPAVTLFIDGPDRWRYEEDWPLTDETRVSLRLGAQQDESIDSLNSGLLGTSSTAEAGPVELSYTPEDGPFLNAMLSSSGRLQIDMTETEAANLTWTSAPLSQPVEVTGHPTLTLSVNPSTEDADIVAQISDVAPDGTSRQVVQTYLNLPRAKDPANPTPLTPDRFAEFTLEFLPMAYVFQEGHSVRISLSGAAVPLPDQSNAQGPGKNPDAFTLKIAQDGDNAPRLELPVIGKSPSEWSR